jgi:hypothetical protein
MFSHQYSFQITDFKNLFYKVIFGQTVTIPSYYYNYWQLLPLFTTVTFVYSTIVEVIYNHYRNLQLTVI